MGAECGRSGSSSSLQSLGGEMGHLTSPRWGLPPPPISAHRLPSPLLHPGLLSPQLLCGLPQTARLLWASDSALLSRGVCRVLPGPSAGSQEKRGQCLQNKAAFRGQRLGMGFGGLGCEGCAWVDPTWHPAQGLAWKTCPLWHMGRTVQSSGGKRRRGGLRRALEATQGQVRSRGRRPGVLPSLLGKSDL